MIHILEIWRQIQGAISANAVSTEVPSSHIHDFYLKDTKVGEFMKVEKSSYANLALHVFFPGTKIHVSQGIGE